MFRWLIEQRYVVANPFAGIKVRAGARSSPMDEGRVFSEGEWAIIRAVANGLECSYGWKLPAAQRLRFVLDFAYATGLRSSEFVGATLGQIETDVHGDHWLKLVGKGSKAGKVALPPLAKVALDHYLMPFSYTHLDVYKRQRCCSASRSRYKGCVDIAAMRSSLLVNSVEALASNAR